MQRADHPAAAHPDRAVQLSLRSRRASDHRADRHGRVLELELFHLSAAADGVDVPQLCLLPSETITVAKFGVDLHQLQPKVGSLGLVIECCLQQLSSLVEAPIGDVNIRFGKRVGSGRRNGFDAFLRSIGVRNRRARSTGSAG